MGNEGSRGYLLILKRVAQFILVIIVADVIGLDVLFYVLGGLSYFSFMGSLILLLMLEGCVVGVAGGFVYLGLDMIAVARREAHNTAITQEQLKRKEKRESRQRWATTMVTAGLLMIFTGLLISSLTQI